MQSQDDDDFGDFAGTGGSEPSVLPVTLLLQSQRHGTPWMLFFYQLTETPHCPIDHHQSSGISTNPST
jgi:hypothetical protein